MVFNINLTMPLGPKVDFNRSPIAMDPKMQDSLASSLFSSSVSPFKTRTGFKETCKKIARKLLLIDNEFYTRSKYNVLSIYKEILRLLSLYFITSRRRSTMRKIKRIKNPFTHFKYFINLIALYDFTKKVLFFSYSGY